MAPALLLPGTVLARWQHTSQGPAPPRFCPMAAAIWSCGWTRPLARQKAW
ncbi:hypothetical protein [Acidovorax sp.]|nr:hypothetical protein [Acidovorax sp.]